MVVVTQILNVELVNKNLRTKLAAERAAGKRTWRAGASVGGGYFSGPESENDGDGMPSASKCTMY